jgi:hypothetical protein
MMRARTGELHERTQNDKHRLRRLTPAARPRAALRSATYIVNGATDPAWNELDMGFINNILGQARIPSLNF